MKVYVRLNEQACEKVVRAYGGGVSSALLARRYDINQCTVIRIVKRGGITPVWPHRSKLSNHEVLNVMSRYALGIPAAALAKEFHVDAHIIRKTLIKHGMAVRSTRETSRKYSVDHAAFSRKSPEVSYWFGFLSADGCIPVTTSGQKVIQLVLSSKDAAHLRKFLTFLRADYPIRIARRPTCTAAGVSITSPSMHADLVRLGLKPRKSCRAVAGRFSADGDFWRGYIDGDGSFYRRKGGRIRFSLCGSLLLLEEFITFIGAHSIHSRARPYPHSKSPIWYLTLGARATSALARLLYPGSVSLDRKAALAKEAATW